MFDKIAEAILGNYPDNSQARELEILYRILALIILGAVIYLFTEEEDSDPVKHKVVYSVLILSLIIILFVSNKICKIRHNERAKMMATQNELQQTIIAYNKANTERVKAETEKIKAEIDVIRSSSIPLSNQ